MRLPRPRGWQLKRLQPRTVAVHVVAWAIGLIWLIPFLGVFMAAIRPLNEILYGWWDFSSFNPSLSDFLTAWNDPQYPMSQGLANTFIVAIPGTLVPMFVATLAAYGFARFSFRTRDYLFLTIVLLMAVPQQMVAIPLFLQMVQLGLVDSFLGLILVHSAWGIPWILLFMRNFFQTLPLEVEEAARVDGASDFRIFSRIVLPMSLPALGAVAVLQFMWVWNDFFFATILLQSSDKLVATQRVVTLAFGQYSANWALLSAATLLAISVPVLVYSFLQRYYIRGMIGWTIKG